MEHDFEVRIDLGLACIHQFLFLLFTTLRLLLLGLQAQRLLTSKCPSHIALYRDFSILKHSKINSTLTDARKLFPYFTTYSLISKQNYTDPENGH